MNLSKVNIDENITTSLSNDEFDIERTRCSTNTPKGHFIIVGERNNTQNDERNAQVIILNTHDFKVKSIKIIFLRKIKNY